MDVGRVTTGDRNACLYRRPESAQSAFSARSLRDHSPQRLRGSVRTVEDCGSHDESVPGRASDDAAVLHMAPVFLPDEHPVESRLAVV